MHARVVGSTCPPKGQGSQVQDQKFHTCYDESQARMPAAAACWEGLDIGVERTGLLLLMLSMRLQPQVHQMVQLSKAQAGLTLGPRPALMPWAVLGLGSMGQS